MTDLAKKKETLATKSPNESNAEPDSRLEVATVPERPGCDDAAASSSQQQDTSDEESEVDEDDAGSLFWRTKESFTKK